MANWTLKGLAGGVQTTHWPAVAEHTPGVTPGRPQARADATETVEHCPTSALFKHDGGTGIDFGRCIHCQRCRHGDAALDWVSDFTWASASADNRGSLPRRFARSLHVRYVDAGACGGCMGEVRLIDAPAYNMHRLGIFITETPRNADVLLIAGPVTEAMREPLCKTYAAMPEPKRVVAMGVCAINGGVFGESFASAGGAAGVIPVDITIPGCPPPPLAIVDALLAVTGRSDLHDPVEKP